MATATDSSTSNGGGCGSTGFRPNDEQAQLDAALDAALDVLDDSDDEDNDDAVADASAEASSSLPCAAMPEAPTMSETSKAATSSKASTTSSSHPPAVMGPPRPPPKAKGKSPSKKTEDWSPDKLFEDMMKQMVEGSSNDGINGNHGDEKVLQDEFLGQLLSEMQKMQQSMENGGTTTTSQSSTNKASAKQSATSNGNTAGRSTGKARKEDIKSSTAVKQTSGPSKLNSGSSSDNVTPSSSSFDAEKAQVEAAFAKMMQGITEQSQHILDDDDNDDSAFPEPDSELAMLQGLLQSIASVAGLADELDPSNVGGSGSSSNGKKEGINGSGDKNDAFNADAVVDGMIQQLLSKDLMYEPMKQVANRFPAWLQEHKDTLSAKEYAERQKQCDYFLQLVDVYENDPHNVDKLMQLMQDVQDYGQPPIEIIQEIVPGMELDEQGLPKLDDSTAGLPFGGNSNEECVIM